MTFNALEIQEDQIPEMIFEENKVKETCFSFCLFHCSK